MLRDMRMRGGTRVIIIVFRLTVQGLPPSAAVVLLSRQGVFQRRVLLALLLGDQDRAIFEEDQS